MKHVMDDAIKMFLDPTIPSWGESEVEIDPPTWTIAEHGTDPSFPGGGLARHDMLYIGEGNNRMYVIVGGKVVWTYCAGKGNEFDDVWMMTNGNIAYSRMYWAALISPDKKQLWRMDAPEGCEIHTLQPIGLDHLMVLVGAKPYPLLRIVNTKTGQTELEREVPFDQSAPNDVHVQHRRFRLTAQNTYLVPYLSLNKVVEFDRDFNELWSYDTDKPWAAIRLKNGNTLISDEKNEITREVRPDKSIAWEFAVSDLPEEYRLSGTQSCVRLENGNTILCARGQNGKTPQMVEVTPDKKVVWVIKDWKNLGPCSAVQILRDGGIPEKPGDCQR